MKKSAIEAQQEQHRARSIKILLCTEESFEGKGIVNNRYKNIKIASNLPELCVICVCARERESVSFIKIKIVKFEQNSPPRTGVEGKKRYEV